MIEPQRFPFQFIPDHVVETAKRYCSEMGQGNDPPDAQRIYENLKFEIALVEFVCIFVLWAQFRTSSSFY